MKLTPFQFIFWTCWVLFIFALTSILSNPAKQERITAFLSRAAKSPFFLPVFFAFLLGLMLCFWGPHWWRNYRQQQLQQRLATDGVSQLAQIVRVEDTGITINRNPRIRLTVLVQAQEASFEMTVSRVNIPRPGDFITVRYDPKDLTKVVPD